MMTFTQTRVGFDPDTGNVWCGPVIGGITFKLYPSLIKPVFLASGMIIGLADDEGNRPKDVIDVELALTGDYAGQTYTGRFVFSAELANLINSDWLNRDLKYTDRVRTFNHEPLEILTGRAAGRMAELTQVPRNGNEYPIVAL